MAICINFYVHKYSKETLSKVLEYAKSLGVEDAVKIDDRQLVSFTGRCSGFILNYFNARVGVDVELTNSQIKELFSLLKEVLEGCNKIFKKNLNVSIFDGDSISDTNVYDPLINSLIESSTVCECDAYCTDKLKTHISFLDTCFIYSHMRILNNRGKNIILSSSEV